MRWAYVHHHQLIMTPAPPLLSQPLTVGGFPVCVCVCVLLEVGFNSATALDPSHSLVPLSLSFLLSPFLCFFPVSTSGAPTELPSSSEIQRKSFLGLILTHIQAHTMTSSLDLPPLIRPPTDILFVSCSSSAPSDEHKPGRHGVNRAAVSEEKAARKNS